MLWYCSYTYQPGVTAEQVGRRFVERHDAGANHPDRIRHVYSLAGGGAGFLLVEADDPNLLNEMLVPYMDLVSWDVRAIVEDDYDRIVERYRQR
jgi:hypothetical protein